jgi:DNA-binding beta-propeller fold protein YncE
MRIRSTALCAAAAAFTLLGTTISPAQAVEPETVTDGLVTPLSLAVSDDGTVYVAQNFAGMLTMVAPGGEKSLVYADEAGSEVGAVSAAGDVVTFATTGGTRKAPTADLWRISAGGDPARLADLYRYEKRNNPDAARRYGIVKAGRSCLQKLPRFLHPHRGIVESHPYATALGDGVTYVADAAGNSILEVSDTGGVKTVAVLPATRLEVTRAMKREFGLPSCVIGKMYRSEGVPTDVEMGPDGDLYVTSLPGAPGEFGPYGRVYRINPDGGIRNRMAEGLLSPVGLAIAPSGDAYVSQLFAGSIVMVPAAGGDHEVVAEVPAPGDVELSGDWLYATDTDLFSEGGNGKVLRWDTTAAPE